MPASLRLAFRLQSFELVVLVGACLALAAACGILSWQLTSMMSELEACQRSASESGFACQAVEARMTQIGNLTYVFTGLATIAPFLVGIFLGAPLVAREIERGTTSLAWSLSPSRSTWLAYRVLPIAGVVAVALLVLGQASEAAILATPPGRIDFRYFAMHGPLLAVRGLAVFGIGLVVGALMGRSLPAILVTGIVVVPVFLGLTYARSELMRAEAVWVDAEQEGSSYSYVHESGFRLDDTGEIIGFEEAFQRYPEVFAEDGEQIPPDSTMVYRVNPPEQYGSFVLRESLALGGLTMIAAGLSMAVVRVRSPR